LTKNLLYIEDDQVDVLSLKRILKNYEDVKLTVVESFASLLNVDLETFDAIITDSNLPDADYLKLKTYLGVKPNVQFISGTGIDGEPIWLKPISKENLDTLCCFKNVTNLDYIASLAQGDNNFEIDMLETALKVLPERLMEIKNSVNSLNQLKLAAHRTKSSYGVCGMDAVELNKVEELSEVEYEDKKALEGILNKIETTITLAIKELEALFKNKAQFKS